MATTLLNEIIEKTSNLTKPEKQKLIEILLEDSIPSKKKEVSQNIIWLKKHRKEVAGKYVALDNGNLVGEGKSLREAETKATQNGSLRPLITYVPAEDEEIFGGW